MSRIKYPSYKNIFSPMAFLCFLVSAILIFVNNQSLQIFLSRDFFRSLSPRTLESTTEAGKGEAKAFDPALMESVLSIVQGYYVDSDRVTLDKLLEGALHGLSLSVQNTYYTDEGNSFELSLNGKKIDLAKSSGEDSNAFLLTVRQLCKFLDENNISENLTGSARAIVGTEKQASTILLNAILSSLDAHSNLMSPESYRELRQGTDGEFGGLGIIVGVRDNILTVLKPIPRSPASLAGVLKGDRIIAINQQSTFGLNLDQLITHMRGEPGTPAQLTILREGLFSPIEVVVNRAVIEVDSVESFSYHDGNLHYLRLVIDSFASRTADEVESSIKEFKRRYPMNGLILDLRSNPGGLLDQAVAVSDLFLKSGVIVSTHGRRNETERVSKKQHKFLDFPITVLMDENSASASEIVAGALQDNGRALVVGQPSYGKGSVQTLFELHGERALKLTIARYLTPNHRSIQNKGIMPDIWIQPITKSNSNSGMFGLSRFKSEAFLPNHLLSNFDNSYKIESSFNISGYYLKSENSSDSESDVELKIAELVFSKTKKIYGDRLPEGSQRSSHLIALSQPEVESFIKVKSKEIENWLFKQQNITWSGAIDSRRKSVLQFQLDKLKLVSKVGSSLEIPWTLKNSDANAVENISVFMHAPYVGLESEELLVGSLKSGETKRGVLNIKLNSRIETGIHRILIGVAQDTLPILNLSQTLPIEIVSGELPKIEISISLRESDSSLIPNILEANERAELMVNLKNLGYGDLKNLKLNVANLSGAQVKFLKNIQSEFDLAKNSSKILTIPIGVDAALKASVLRFGAYIESKDILDGASELLEVSTSIEGGVAKNMPKVAH